MSNPPTMQKTLDRMLSRLIQNVQFWMSEGDDYETAKAYVLKSSVAGPAMIAKLDEHFSKGPQA